MLWPHSTGVTGAQAPLASQALAGEKVDPVHPGSLQATLES
jgi:hypothetical protein